MIMAFTREQQQAIDTRGTNIIVSAGAGSGKTAVLTERIFKMLCDGYDISRLLVLTFTNAAALEMKTRIKNKVASSGILDEQVSKIDTAYITTFDAFSLSLVKKYHYLLGVSKELTIVDSIVVELKKQLIIDDIFNKLYKEQNKEFLDLLTKFTFKDDSEFKSSILKIADKLEKTPNKENFLHSYLDEYYSDYVIDAYIKLFIKECNERLKDLLLTANEMYTLTPDSKLGEFLAEFIDFLKLEHSYEEIVAYFATYKMPSSPKGDEEVKELRKKLKAEIDKFALEFLNFDNVVSIKNSLFETKEYATTIINILLEYFKRVKEFKYSQNIFEFDDISMMLLDLLNSNDEVLKEVSLSFDEILLDEYQDTSDIQEAFISLISRNNVYMVGDIKQSIYRFRNANPYIFKEKYDNYKNNFGGIKIDLNKNFRSRSEVLNNINLMFMHLMTNQTGDADYISEHQMNYGNTLYDTYKTDGFSYEQEYLTYTPDEMKIYSNDEIEAFIVANKIKELIDAKISVYDNSKKIYRQIQYKDIAIILPRKRNLELIQKIFTSEGIPLNVAIDEKITDSPIIKLVCSLLNLVRLVDSNEYQEYSYYFVSVARSFLFRQSDNVILNESFSNYKNNEIYDIAKRVSNYSKVYSVSKTFEYLLTEFNVYNSLIKIGDVNKHLLVISYLADMISNLTEYQYDFKEIAKHFEVIIDKEIDISYSNKTNVNGVVLINIHKSKGLEYPICFFADLNGGFNRDDIKESFLLDKDFGFITPYFSDTKEDTILKLLYKHKYIKEDISERIRLFYVALTRAREKMYFVIPKVEYLKEVASPFLFNSYANFISYYYDEAVRKFAVDTEYDEYINKDYLDFSASNYSEKINKVTPLKYTAYDFIPEVVKKRRISKTIDELITKETAIVLKRGTRLHEILQVINFNDVDFSQLNLSISEEHMLKEVLNLECFKNISSAKVYKEYEFSYEVLGKKIHGIIDLLVEYDDHFEIIDYKLSDIDKEEYIVQLNEYYKYLRLISDKEIKMYLVSITKAKLKEVYVLK